MIIRLSLVALLCAASLGWAAPPERAASSRATHPAVAQVVTDSAPAWRRPRPEADDAAPRQRSSAPLRPAADPAVKQERAFQRDPMRSEQEVTTTPIRARPDPAADELSVRSPGPAASVELVPDEAETRCMRTEGQMRCTPLNK